MVNIRKIFLFYLQDTLTGLCYFVDNGGNVQLMSIAQAIAEGFDISLQDSPDGWMDMELSFTRNATYYGLNRSFSIPMKLVNDAAQIVREKIYNGPGTEANFTLTIFKYNANPQPGEATYKLYYKGLLDLNKLNDIVGEGVQCNLMEGGVSQLLKTYEDVEFELENDGSIPQNIKAARDGMLVPDNFHYQFVPFTIPQNVQQNGDYTALPSIFINNEGDNYGIVHGDPSYTDFGGGAFGDAPWVKQRSSQYLFYSAKKIQLTITGSIVLGLNNENGVDFPYSVINLFLATDTSSFQTIDGKVFITSTVPLIPNRPGLNIGQDSPSYVGIYNTILTQQQTFYFTKTITLDAYEKLYMISDVVNEGGYVNVISGDFTISFNSAALPSRVWGLTASDVFILLGQRICAAASTTTQKYYYPFESSLLLKFLNIFVTCGDALTASSDPNFSRFYNKFQLSNTPTLNTFIAYGPVIKTTLKEFFTSISAILCAALGTQILPGEVEQLFFEEMGYVYNTEGNQFDIGEVADLEIIPADKYQLSQIDIGYEPPILDQKAGKYEYNTTLKMIAQILSESKKLSLISKYSASPYLIERLAAGLTSAPTSTTNNNNDNTVCLLNIDRSKQSFDYEHLSFASTITDYNTSDNTNIKLINNNAMQPIGISIVDGSYLSLNNDPSIFVFSQVGLSDTKIININYNGFFIGNAANALTSLPADYITIGAYINGVLIEPAQTFTATGPSTPINYTIPTVTRNCVPGDCIYLKYTSSINVDPTSELNTVNIIVTNSDASAYWNALGSGVPLSPGTPATLIALPDVNDTYLSTHAGNPTVTYHFQYYMFNSILNNPNFSYRYNIVTEVNGASTESVTYSFFKNGKILTNEVLTGIANQVPFNLENDFPEETLNVGDIFFILGTATSLNVQILSLDVWFQSSIVSYALLRKQYDVLQGIPNFATDPITGRTRSDIAGAPYNIELFTPKRMLKTWGPFIRGCIYNIPNSFLQFQSLSKNAFLATIFGDDVNIESADEELSSLGDPLFYPWIFKFKTKLPINFADLLTGAANAHIHFTFNGVDFYGFPEDLKQRPGLDEAQEWQLLCSPKTDLSTLVKMTSDGLKSLNMGPNSIAYSFLQPIQFVPQNTILPSKYHTRNRDSFWFREQITQWVNQNDYWQPVQIGDIIPLQFITRDLDPITINIYTCEGKLIYSNNMDTVISPAVSDPYILWQKEIDTTGWAECGHYIEIVAGVGDIAAKYISEGLNVKADWPDTLLFEYTNSKNWEGTFFDADTPFIGAKRIKGMFDNQFKQRYKGSFFVNQPQDIQVLNAIPYETTSLWIGFDGGIPDYESRKILKILLCDGCTIEGEGFSLDDKSTDWDVVFIEGVPTKFYKIDIRPSKNLVGISISAAGVDTDSSILALIDITALGPNANNLSGTTDPVLQQAKLTN